MLGLIHTAGKCQTSNRKLMTANTAGGRQSGKVTNGNQTTIQLKNLQRVGGLWENAYSERIHAVSR